MHRHRRGQLTLAERGTVLCELENGIWLIPANSALWIPSGLLHSTSADADSSVIYLYLEDEASQLPKTPCILRITPLVRELIHHIASVSNDYLADSSDGRIALVLLDQFSLMPTEQFFMSVPRNARLRQIAMEITRNPENRDTISQWAAKLTLSEKSLRRLVSRETGLTFGHWRQQYYLMAAINELGRGLSVDAVAAQLGYKSPSALAQMFKKSFGKAPKTYMRERDAASFLARRST